MKAIPKKMDKISASLTTTKWAGTDQATHNKTRVGASPRYYQSKQDAMDDKRNEKVWNLNPHTGEWCEIILFA